MQNIPEKLKWYQPLGLGWCAGGPPPWRISVDEMTGCVEIKRAPLIQFSVVIFGLVLAAIMGGILYALYVYAPIDDNAKILLARFVVLFPVLMLVGMPAVDALWTLLNARHWKGPLRFRYDPQSCELFFARENVTYRHGEYASLILGCVRGADMKGRVKTFGMWGRGEATGRLAQITQIFMLVRDKNNEWQRHNLTDDIVA